MDKRTVCICLTLLFACGFARGVQAQPNPPNSGPCCWPPPCECTQVDMTGCPGASVRVEKFGNVAGWGSHFSLDKGENGYGGFHPECYIQTDLGGRVSAYCHDGYQDPKHHVNNFLLPLGPRKELDFVEFLISQRGVSIKAQRKALSSFTTEKIPYQISTFFPLRETSGFCSGKTLYMQENGVLNGQANRSGSGYQVTLLPQY